MSKVTEWVSPSCNPEEESDGESLNVTVWIDESKFVHVTVSPTRMVSADGAKLNPLMSIDQINANIGTEVVVEATTGTVVVVDPGAVVVVAAARLDVVVDSAMVVVGAAVEVGEAAIAASVVVDSGPTGTTTSEVETILLVTVPSPTGSSLNSVSPKVPAPCGCCDWHADKTTTQANRAIATFRNSVCGMPNVRT